MCCGLEADIQKHLSSPLKNNPMSSLWTIWHAPQHLLMTASQTAEVACALFYPCLECFYPSIPTGRQDWLGALARSSFFFFFFLRSALQMYFPFPILFSSIEKLSLLVCYDSVQRWFCKRFWKGHCQWGSLNNVAVWLLMKLKIWLFNIDCNKNSFWC